MRFLRWLVRFLPAEFRHDYERELLETVEEQQRDSFPRLGAPARARFWIRQWMSTVAAGVRLRRGRGIIGAADRPPRRPSRWSDGVGKDVAQSFRALAKRPAFTVTAVVTLGLGIGATTAMFSAVNAVLLRELPYEESDDIVVLRQTRGDALENGMSAANVRDLAEQATTLTFVSGAEAHGLRLVEDGRAYSLRSWLVSAGFFEAVGVTPELGRAFSPEEYLPGGEHVVLLSHRTWQVRFGGDPEIVGRELVLDGAAYSVVGVLPSRFQYPSKADLWAPRPAQPWDDGQRGGVSFDAIARHQPGSTAHDIRAELERIGETLRRDHPEANAALGLRAIPLRSFLFGDVSSPLWLLMAAVALVLLIAACNVSGLQLARGTASEHEFALRGALGASTWRMFRLVAVESVLIAGASVVLGVALAHLGVELVRALGPQLPRIEEMRVDRGALAFALGAAVLSALVSGVAPALRASRTGVQKATAGVSRGATRGPRRGRLRDRLVIGEIAVALVLAVTAGLLLRSLDRLLAAELGFDPAKRVVAQVWAYDEGHRAQLDFFDESKAAIERLPGIERVGLTTSLPWADDASILARENAVRFTIERRARGADGADPIASLSVIDRDYAGAMGIALTAGRSFEIYDHAESPPVALVNEAFVRRHFSGQPAVGRRITLDWRRERSYEIIGVLDDVRPRGFESMPRPEVYVSLAQEPANGLTFVVQAAGDASDAMASVQRAMWAVDPGQAIWAARPMEDLLHEWSRERRFQTTLLSVFAALAVLLAATGIYGLMAFAVAERFKEFGIRRALGGQTRDIIGIVLRRGLKLTLVGVGLGLVGAAGAAGLLRGLLFDVEPHDPVTFAALTFLVVLVAITASLIPARRASRVDPTVALRAD